MTQAVWSSKAHSCGLFINNRLRCWGYNAQEQLGDSTSADKGSGPAPNSIANSLFVTFAVSINSIPIVSAALGTYFEQKNKN
jgi:hypothetical protein